MAEGDAPEPTKEQLPTPEDLAASHKIASEMEKIGWQPIKPITQRFSVGGTEDSSKTSKGPEEKSGVEEKPRFPTINQEVDDAIKGTAFKRTQDHEALPIKSLPGTMELKFVPQRFSVGGSDASKAVSGTPTETNPTKPESTPPEAPKPNWRTKLPQGNQGK